MSHIQTTNRKTFTPRHSTAGRFVYVTMMATFISSGFADQNPVLVASLNIPQPVTRLAVHGTRAYLTSGLASGSTLGALHIVDIANRTAPTLLGTFRLTRPAWGVAIAGTLAYVADESAGLIIVDVSNPASPVRLGAYNTSGSAYDVVLVDKLAYVADGEAGLVIIDVTDPTQPRRLGGLDGSGEVQQVAVAGHYAYLTDRFWNGSDFQPYGALRIMDVSDPATPKLLAKHQTDGQAWYLAVAGSVAYTGADSLEIFDASDPLNPQRVGSYGTGGAVVIEGNRAFLANFQSGLHVLDITNPAAPLPLGIAPCKGYARDLAVSGGYAYVATQAESSIGFGLQIFEVGPSDPGTLPPLHVAFGGDKVNVSWPATVTGAVLEATAEITSTPNWKLEPTPPSVVGDQNEVTLEVGTEPKFFRLSKP